MVENQVTYRIVVTGRVQRVGFRAFVNRKANALGLSGWVRNRRSGEVEVVVSGPANKVDALIDACRQGPDWAQVDGVEWQEEEDSCTGPFEVRQSI